jgi:Peptidase U49/Protein of unknown function (DUF2934)
MPLSPLVELERYIYAAPFSSAPGKARVLWDALSQEHPLRMVDQSGFWFRAYEKHVEVSYASMDTLWSGAYCYTVLYHDRTAQQRQSEFQPIILEHRAARDAIDLYRWFLNRLHEESAAPWPSDAPRPTIAAENSPERHATEFFLVALAWILHHEFGHLLLHRPIDTTVPTKVREWEADAQATKWLLDGTTDPLVRQKLFVGACIALGFLGARRPPTEESDTHPPPYDRLERILQNATPEDEELAYAVALNVLLTNWAVNGHETWLQQAKDVSFKDLFGEFGRALRHQDQQTWVRINEQKGLLYEHFVRGPLAEDDQRQLAYVLWEERGQPLGSPEIDWYCAGEILRYWRWKLFLKETNQW